MTFELPENPELPRAGNKLPRKAAREILLDLEVKSPTEHLSGFSDEHFEFLERSCPTSKGLNSSPTERHLRLQL